MPNVFAHPGLCQSPVDATHAEERQPHADPPSPCSTSKGLQPRFHQHSTATMKSATRQALRDCPAQPARAHWVCISSMASLHHRQLQKQASWGPGSELAVLIPPLFQRGVGGLGPRRSLSFRWRLLRFSSPSDSSEWCLHLGRAPQPAGMPHPALPRPGPQQVGQAQACAEPWCCCWGVGWAVQLFRACTSANPVAVPSGAGSENSDPADCAGLLGDTVTMSWDAVEINGGAACFWTSVSTQAWLEAAPLCCPSPAQMQMDQSANPPDLAKYTREQAVQSGTEPHLLERCLSSLWSFLCRFLCLSRSSSLECLDLRDSALAASASCTSASTSFAASSFTCSRHLSQRPLAAWLLAPVPCWQAAQTR